jgi:hypothetical protein
MTTKLLLPLLLFLFLAQVSPALADKTMPLSLIAVQKKVQGEFDRIDAGLQQAAVKLGESGLTGEAARTALTGLCSGFSWALDCATVNDQGVMLTIDAPAYQRFEGTSIANQEQVITMLKERRPVMSKVFQTVEGVVAIDAEYPIRSRDGKFLGSVSLVFKPGKLLAEIIQPQVKDLPMDVWAMEPDGYILYDVDTRQIGLDLFTDPLYRPYPSLLELGQRIAKEPMGSGAYQFLDRHGKKVVFKNTSWQTAALYGTAWRLVSVHLAADHAALPDKPAALAPPLGSTK